MYCHLGFAQVSQWSNPVKLKGTAIFTKVLGENEHGVFLLRYRNKFYSKNVIIDKYHHHLNLDVSRSIDLKKSRLVKIIMAQKGILLVRATFHRKSQSNLLLGQYYDYDLRPIGKEIELLRTAFQEFGDRGDFRVRVSDNEQFIAVYHSQKLEQDQTVLFWDLFDANFQKVRRVQKTIGIRSKRFYLNNFMVDNTGNIYSLTREFKEKERQKMRTLDHFFAQEGDSVWTVTMSDTVDYRDLQMSYDRVNKRVVVVGLYGHRDQFGSIGIYVFSYYSNSGEYIQSVTPVTAEVTADLSMGKYNKTVIPDGFEFLKIVPRSDGGIGLYCRTDGSCH